MNIQQKFQAIVSALQFELQEYGGLLHLFDRQKKFMDCRDPFAVLHINVEVAEQIAKLTWCRQQRAQLVSHIALDLGKPKNTILSMMIQSFKIEHQSLMVALVDEIQDLESRTLRRLRESGMLLAQCVDYASQLQNMSNSGSIPETYLDHNKINTRYEQKRMAFVVNQMQNPSHVRTRQAGMEVEQYCLAAC